MIHPFTGRTRPVLSCARPHCQAPAAARMLIPTNPDGRPEFAYLRPLTGAPVGVPVCLDCAHHLIDLMLIDNTPTPAGGQP